MATTVNNSSSTEQIAAPGKVWQTGLIAAAVAAVLNLIVYFIASAAGVPFNLTPAGMPAPPFPFLVVFATFVGVLLGTLVFQLLPRVTRRPISTFRIVAIVALVLSFAQPLLLTTGALPLSEPVQTSTILVLEIMHLVAGVSAIYFLTTRARA